MNEYSLAKVQIGNNSIVYHHIIVKYESEKYNSGSMYSKCPVTDFQFLM